MKSQSISSFLEIPTDITGDPWVVLYMGAFYVPADISLVSESLPTHRAVPALLHLEHHGGDLGVEQRHQI